MVSILSWAYLVVAGLLEIVWALAMKESHGFTRRAPTLIMLISMAGSFGLLALALRSLPLGSAYMIWTGIGAVGAFLASAWFFGETITAQKAIAALLIVAGLITMKLSH